MLNRAIDKYKGLPVQIRASFWFLVCSFLQKGISFLTTPIFTRLLSTAEYGNYGVYTSWESILTVFITLQLSMGVYTQGLVKFEEDRDVFSSSLLGLTSLIAGVWLLLFAVFHVFFSKVFELNTVQLTTIPINVWLMAICAFWSTDQRVDYKYRKLVIITVLASVLRPVAGIIAVSVFEDKVTARILSTTLVYAVLYLGLFISLMRKGKIFFHKKYWGYALAFNLPLLPHYLSTSILNGADRIMIKRMVGEDEAGIYSLAYSVSMIMTTFNTALLKTVEPWLYKNIRNKRFNQFSKVAEPSFILVAILNLLLIVLAPDVIRIFAPSTYYEAIWVIPPVAMSVFFTYIYTFFAVFEFYYEKTAFISVATVIGAAVNIVTNYVFIKIFGYLAAGYTTLFCYMMFALMHYLFMKNIIKENIGDIQVYNMKHIVILSVAFLEIGFSLLFTYRSMIIRYFIVCILLGLAFWKRDSIIKYLKSILELKKS